MKIENFKLKVFDLFFNFQFAIEGDLMSHPHATKAPHGQGHPGGEGAEKKYLPRLIAWEVTRSCILNCVHCRAAAKYGPYAGELDTEACYRFLDDVKSFSDPIIILTGG